MKKATVLELCGLGCRPPDETTCEALQALEACRVVFTDEAPSAAAWLRGYCRKLIVLPASQTDAAKAQRIVQEAKKGGRIGVAVWGHPMLTSPLCRELLRRAKGAEIRVPGAVSPMGTAFARSVNFFGGDYGYHAIEACDVEQASAFRFDAGTPLVIFSRGPADGAAWRRFAESLKDRYPAAHGAYFYPAASQGGALALEQVAERAGAGGAAVLFIPPAAKAGARRKR